MRTYANAPWLQGLLWSFAAARRSNRASSACACRSARRRKAGMHTAVFLAALRVPQCGSPHGMPLGSGGRLGSQQARASWVRRPLLLSTSTRACDEPTAAAAPGERLACAPPTWVPGSSARCAHAVSATEGRAVQNNVGGNPDGDSDPSRARPPRSDNQGRATWSLESSHWVASGSIRSVFDQQLAQRLVALRRQNYEGGPAILHRPAPGKGGAKEFRRIQ